MKRKMKKLTNLNDLYSDLADDEKLEFRKAYSVKKDFEFVDESRVERKSWSRETNEAGEFMTELQIYKLLGGDMPEEFARQEAKEQTATYLEFCKLAPDEMVSEATAVGVPMYKYIRRLTAERSAQTFLHEVKCLNKVNKWEQLAMENRAIETWAEAHSKQPSKELLTEIAASELGVEGESKKELAKRKVDQAQTNETPGTPNLNGLHGRGAINGRMTKAQDAGGNAETPPPRPPKLSKEVSHAQKAERDAKALLARHTHCANQVQAMKQAMANAETQGWAQTFPKAAGDAQKELDDAYSKDQFPNKLRAASLSPVLMKNLKK